MNLTLWHQIHEFNQMPMRDKYLQGFIDKEDTLSSRAYIQIPPCNPLRIFQDKL